MTANFHSVSRAVLALVFVGVLVSCSPKSDAPQQPSGKEKTTKTEMLESGAAILQSDSPLQPMNIYLDGFHAAKDNPAHQMEAHHYCRQVNEDFAQCVLFDGNTRQANLIGIEYIISETLFETLPEEEKQYWHPHNYEILSGQLIAPGIPGIAEKELMKDKMNSYGKTWHVWNSALFGETGDKMPLGEAVLAWSFNQDGEALPGLVEKRDQRMGISSNGKRDERAELKALAKPQAGVDSLKGKFSTPERPLSDVEDKKAGGAK